MIRLILSDFRKELRLKNILLPLVYFYVVVLMAITNSYTINAYDLWAQEGMDKAQVVEQLTDRYAQGLSHIRGGIVLYSILMFAVLYAVWVIMKEIPVCMNRGMFLCPLNTGERMKYLYLQIALKMLFSVVFFNLLFICCFGGLPMFYPWAELTPERMLWTGEQFVYLFLLLFLINTKVKDADKNHVGDKQEELMYVLCPLVIIGCLVVHYVLWGNAHYEGTFLAANVMFVIVVLFSIFTILKCFRHTVEMALSYEKCYVNREGGKESAHIHCYDR